MLKLGELIGYIFSKEYFYGKVHRKSALKTNAIPLFNFYK